MKMKSVKAVLILLLLIAGMVTGYLLWKMKEPEYEKEGLFVDNGTKWQNRAKGACKAGI